MSWSDVFVVAVSQYILCKCNQGRQSLVNEAAVPIIFRFPPFSRPFPSSPRQAPGRNDVAYSTRRQNMKPILTLLLGLILVVGASGQGGSGEEVNSGAFRPTRLAFPPVSVVRGRFAPHGCPLCIVKEIDFSGLYRVFIWRCWGGMMAWYPPPP